MPTLKGSMLSPEHRRKVGEGVKNSSKWQKGMRNRKVNYADGSRGISIFDSQRLSVAEHLRGKAEERGLGFTSFF